MFAIAPQSPNQVVCEQKIRTVEWTLTQSSSQRGEFTLLCLKYGSMDPRPLPARHVVEGEWPQEVAIVSPSWP